MNIVVIIENSCVVGVYSTDPDIKEVAVIDLDETVDREHQLDEFIQSPDDFAFEVEYIKDLDELEGSILN